MWNYYNEMKEAKSLEELKDIYRKFADAFCEDRITAKEFHILRDSFHTIRKIRIVEQ